MGAFIEIPGLDPEEQERISAEIIKRIEEKKAAGLLTEKEIREIEEMRLRPNADILDVQGVYEPLKFGE